MFEENAQLQACGGNIWRWLSGMYGRDMVLAVAREADRNGEVINLRQLLHQMSKRPKVVSRKRFIKKLDLSEAQSFLIPINENWFTKNIGAGAYADVAMIKKDINRLEKKCKRVMKFRHKVVAHRSSEAPPLTIKDIHEAMEVTEEMMKKYLLLFTGKALLQATPTPQYEYLKAFTLAWMPLQAKHN
jgi:hypothetical protein